MADQTAPTNLQVPAASPVTVAATPSVHAAPSPAAEAPGVQPAVRPIQDVLNVNFIRDQRARFNKQIAGDKVIAKYMSWAVAVFMVVLIVVVAVEYLLSLQDQKIHTSITETNTRLSGLSTLEQQYLIYAQKLKLMYTLDTERAAKQEATAYFYQLVPTTNILKSVSTDNDKQKPIITYTIQSPDVFTLLALLKLFSSQTITDKGYSIQSQHLSRVSDGTYTFDGTLDYSKAAALKVAGTTGTTGGK